MNEGWQGEDDQIEIGRDALGLVDNVAVGSMARFNLGGNFPLGVGGRGQRGAQIGRPGGTAGIGQVCVGKLSLPHRGLYHDFLRRYSSLVGVFVLFQAKAEASDVSRCAEEGEGRP